ncbi:hypothetical protein PC121_g3225 [Phytophthora cactorum]|nr:hypothetical protein PC121_g3225 [Phytophthora cactorum]
MQATSGRAKSAKRRCQTSKKKAWTRGRPVTRSAGKNAEREADGSAQQEDPKNYREGMRSRLKKRWLESMAKELRSLEANCVREFVRMPRGVNVLHTKGVYKTKDAEGHIEHLKARLAACGNEQEFGVDYGIKFAAVTEMVSVKLILVLTWKWRVPVSSETFRMPTLRRIRKPSLPSSSACLRALWFQKIS